MSSDVKALVEAALFMAGRNVSVRELAEVVGVSLDEIRSALDLLATEYNERPGGIVVEWGGKSAAMHVRPEIEDKIMSLAPATQMNKAMLKTLAVIATEGPIKKSDLVKMRGNRVYYYVKKLLDEELISAKKAGRTRMLYVTPKFKQYFKIKEIPRAGDFVEPEVEQVQPEEEGVAVVEEQKESNENHVNFEMK